MKLYIVLFCLLLGAGCGTTSRFSSANSGSAYELPPDAMKATKELFEKYGLTDEQVNQLQLWSAERLVFTLDLTKSAAEVNEKGVLVIGATKQTIEVPKYLPGVSAQGGSTLSAITVMYDNKHPNNHFRYEVDSNTGEYRIAVDWDNGVGRATFEEKTYTLTEGKTAGLYISLKDLKDVVSIKMKGVKK